MKFPFHRSAWLFLPLAVLLAACATHPETSAIESLTPNGSASSINTSALLEKSAIETVLNKCASNSAYVNQSKLSAGEAATYLADSMQTMDTQDCPQDFRQAFQEHIMAWREAAPYLANNTPLNTFLEHFK